MEISVIVPVYNVEKYLPECLDSILNQTFSDFELLLIDDGSTDGSYEICKKYAMKDKRIKLFHQKNEGLGAARNTGLNHITGQFLCFVDSDDMISNDFLKIAYQSLVASGADSVIMKITRSVPFPEPPLSLIQKCYNREDNILRILSGLGTCCQLFKKSVWGELRFPEKVMCEDLCPAFEYASLSDRTVVLNYPYYFYRRRSGSITASPFNEYQLTAISEADRLNLLIEGKTPQFSSLGRQITAGYRFQTVNKIILAGQLKQYHVLVSRLRQEFKMVSKNLKFSIYPFKTRVALYLFGLLPLIFYASVYRLIKRCDK